MNPADRDGQDGAGKRRLRAAGVALSLLGGAMLVLGVLHETGIFAPLNASPLVPGFLVGFVGIVMIVFTSFEDLAAEEPTPDEADTARSPLDDLRPHARRKVENRAVRPQSDRHGTGPIGRIGPGHDRPTGDPP